MKQHLFKSVTIAMAALIGWAASMAIADGSVLTGLSAPQFKSMLEQPRPAAGLVLLDIRTPQEFADGHIRGAILIDYYSSDFAERLKSLDRDQTYLIYCRSGNRTGRSLAIFEKLGFTHVYHLEKGLIEWVREKYPLVRDEAG